MELHEVPGYNEAVAQVLAETEALREFAFTDFPAKILDLEVSQLTLRKFFMLACANNPMLFGGSVQPEHVVQFLWVVSLDFNPEDIETRDAFVSLVAEMPFAETVEAIRRYCRDALMDRPPASAEADPAESPTCWLAYFIHQFARAYKWTEDQILDKPMARLYQLLRRIILAENPRFKFINSRLTLLEIEYADKAAELEEQTK